MKKIWMVLLLSFVVSMDVSAEEEFNNPYSAISESIVLTNNYRSEVKRKPLAENGILNQIAYDRAVDMYNRGYFDHYDPNTHKPMWVQAGKPYGVTPRGENIFTINMSNADSIAWTSGTIWRDSPGHYENIIDRSYKEIGTAMVECPNGQWYAVQIFR